MPSLTGEGTCSGGQRLTSLDTDLPCDRLWLPDWIYACSTPHGAVFLDARRNHYFGMSLDDTRALLRLLCNPPASFAGAGGEWRGTDDESLRRMARELIASGVLSREPPTAALGKKAEVSLEGRLYSVGQEIEDATKVMPIHVMRIALASLQAKRDMRFRSIDAIAHDLRRRKATVRPPVPERDNVVRLVSVFRQVRPYIFQARDHCLFHALSLVRFLLAFDTPATWVIGVKTKPWGAHSWAQYEDLILDSSPESVVEYAPILAV